LVHERAEPRIRLQNGSSVRFLVQKDTYRHLGAKNEGEARVGIEIAQAKIEITPTVNFGNIHGITTKWDES